MPILELRGGLIAAALLGLNIVPAFIICIIGNLLPIPFILLLINKILDKMRNGKKSKKIADWLDKKVEKRKGQIEKFGYLGLVLFVGIPLPGTGAWTGTLAASFLNLDFKNAIDRLKIQNKKFDIIFMDPPYYKNMFIDALSSIDEADLLCDDGIIVVEHDTKDKFVDKIGRLEKTRDKKYGNTTMTFYKMEE